MGGHGQCCALSNSRAGHWILSAFLPPFASHKLERSVIDVVQVMSSRVDRRIHVNAHDIRWLVRTIPSTESRAQSRNIGHVVGCFSRRASSEFHDGFKHSFANEHGISSEGSLKKAVANDVHLIPDTRMSRGFVQPTGI